MKTPAQIPLVEEKPVRVTVPVAPHVLAAFRDLAAIQGVSVGRAMGEWMRDTIDGVEAMTQLMEKAKRAPHLAVRELSGYAMGLSELTTQLVDEVRAKSRTGAGERLNTVAKSVAVKVATPPYSNTGGKVQKTSTKVLKKRGSKGS